MSQTVPQIATCPACGAVRSLGAYSAIDADTIPPEVEAILSGTFAQVTCEACGAGYRLEHPMLFVSHQRRLWIVMQPLAERADFAILEPAVARTIDELFHHWAPAILADRLRGVRPRLVFGQHMLTEAVRASYQGIDAALLECAKLLTVRRNLDRLMAHGPFELCFERFDERGAPVCAIHQLPGGARTGELTLPNDILAEVTAAQAGLRASFPALFELPYVSATRYLIGASL